METQRRRYRTPAPYYSSPVRRYFGRGSEEEDKIGFLDENTRAIFGRSYAAEPETLIEQLRKDEAIRAKTAHNSLLALRFLSDIFRRPSNQLVDS